MPRVPRCLKDDAVCASADLRRGSSGWMKFEMTATVEAQESNCRQRAIIARAKAIHQTHGSAAKQAKTKLEKDIEAATGMTAESVVSGDGGGSGSRADAGASGRSSWDSAGTARGVATNPRDQQFDLPSSWPASNNGGW